MSSGRRRKQNNDDDELFQGIPFIDALTDEELPLDQLDEFIVPGSDEKGRKVTISFNIPPAMDRHIDVLLASRRFPYANRKDLVRHGLVRHLSWLTLEARKTIPRQYWSMFEAISEQVRDDEAAMKMEQVFNSLHDRVNEHVSRGEQNEVVRLVSHIDQHIKQMPPSTWVTRFAQRFYQRYSPVLRGMVIEVMPVMKEITDK